MLEMCKVRFDENFAIVKIDILVPGFATPHSRR